MDVGGICCCEVGCVGAVGAVVVDGIDVGIDEWEL